MTEAEWLACSEAEPMLAVLSERKIHRITQMELWDGIEPLPANPYGDVGDRKMRLFAVACCRRAEYTLPFLVFPERIEDCLNAVAVAERYADSQSSASELQSALDNTDRLGDGWHPHQAVASSEPLRMFQVAHEAFQYIAEYELSRLRNPDDPGCLSR